MAPARFLSYSLKKVTRLKRFTPCNFVTLLTFHILLRFFVTDDEMNYTVWCGDEKTIKIFP